MWGSFLYATDKLLINLFGFLSFTVLMKKIIIVVAVLLVLFSNNAHSQELTALPDISFWNTPPSFQFHTGGKDFHTVERPIFLNFDTNGHANAACLHLAETISRYYMGTPSSNSILSNSVDTDFYNLLAKTKILLNKSNYINTDYCRGKDTAYESMLLYLYNALLDTSITDDYKFLEIATNYCNLISNSSPVKQIAYLQWCGVEANVRIKSFSIPEWSRAYIDSSTQQWANAVILNSEDLSFFYEALGDYWQDYNFGKSYQYYVKASDLEKGSNTGLMHVIHQQRVREKIMLLIYNSSEMGAIFREDVFMKLGTDNNALMKVGSADIKEFKCHNALLNLKSQMYLRLNNIDATKMTATRLDDEGDFYLEKNEDVLKEDAALYLNLVEQVLTSCRNFKAARNCQILYLNVLIRYNLIRNNDDFAKLLLRLFSVNLSSGNFSSAKIINGFIAKESQFPNSNFDYYTRISRFNMGQIYYRQNNLDSAEIILKAITPLPEGVIDDINEEANSLLKEIAYKKGDLNLYRENDKKQKKFTNGISLDYASVIQFLTDRNRDFRDIALKTEIAFKDSLAIKNLRLSMQSDSLRNSESERNHAVQARLTDSLRNTRDLGMANKKLADNRQRTIKLVILFSFLLFCVSGVVILVLQRNKAQINEKEKALLELENLRAPLLGHAIGKRFTSVISDIEIGIHNKDPLKFQSAIKRLEALNNVFHEILAHSSERVSLFKEISFGIDYIKSGPERIKVTTHVEKQLAMAITVPYCFLLDFYVNSIEHGKLENNPDGEMNITLEKVNVDNFYKLIIDDNGTGFKPDLGSDASSGLKRVSKTLDYLNMERYGWRLSFDKGKDIFNLADVIPGRTGTRVVININKDDSN